MSAMHLTGSSTAWTQLIHRYSGNSLVLKIAAVAIRDLFDRSIDRFLKQNILFFGEISNLLAQPIDRLSCWEALVLQRLADHPDGLTLEQLQQCAGNVLTANRLMELVYSLQRQSLLETCGDRLIVPSIIQHYCLT